MNMTIMTAERIIDSSIDCEYPSVDEMCRFLAEYSSWLLGSGATCIRLEKNVTRMADAYGMRAELTIMPRHIHLSVWDKNGPETATAIISAKAACISFNINTRLSELSWEVADRRIGYADAIRKFNEIVSDDSQNKWLLLVLVALANASFCRLFGGDVVAMCVVCIATSAGYYLKQQLMAMKVDIRVVVIVCAFVSAVLGATDILFDIGTTPAVALGTSVLYLVPGIPFLNSFSDMLYRHYICAFSRFVDAVVLTCCLSIGLCAAMLLMNVGMF